MLSKLKLFIFLSFIVFANVPLQAEQDYWKAEEYYQNSSSQKEAAADLMKYVPLKGHEKILDVGCGDGKITAEIANRLLAGEILGLDISKDMIDFAKSTFGQEQYPNLKFVREDAQNINFHGEFDIIFSFTALMWLQNHDVFLKAAHQSLKSDGILAATMPMGLPVTLEQAVTELISTPQWSSYFQGFTTGWNFVDDESYGALLLMNHFMPTRLAVIPQRDVFSSREIFQKFISQWFPYLRPLPHELKALFMNQVIDRFLELESPFPNGEVHFKVRRLEIVARKS